MRVARLALFILVYSFFIPALAYALSEPEYEELRRESPAFREADQQLGEIWKLLMEELDEDYKAKVREDQREWLKSTRDIKARIYMEQGIEKAKAYAKAALERVNFLNKILVNYQNNSEAMNTHNNNPETQNNLSPKNKNSETPMASIWRSTPRLHKLLYAVGVNEGMFGFCMATYKSNEQKMQYCLQGVGDVFVESQGLPELINFIDEAYEDYKYTNLPPSVLIAQWFYAKVNNLPLDRKELQILNDTYHEKEQNNQTINNIENSLKSIRQ